MSEKNSPKEIIDAYRKQQARSQKWPKIIFWGFVGLILVASVGLIYWFVGDQKPGLSLSIFASETPTPTHTLRHHRYHQPIRQLPPQRRHPSQRRHLNHTDAYNCGTVHLRRKEGDTLYSLALKFELEVLVLVEANQERLELDPENPIIRVGDELLIPPAGTELATPTPLPEGLPQGTKIEYMVQSGDTMAVIADKFNSTVESILEENELEDPNAIFVGQILVIRVNLVTPVPTEAEPEATLTPTTGG